jgi:cysteinyl-tRNA synthetase
MNKLMEEGKVRPDLAASTLAAWDKIDSVLGIGARDEFNVPEELNSLLEARQAARRAKDFKRSDAIRDELKAKGWAIEDTPKGPRLKRM